MEKLTSDPRENMFWIHLLRASVAFGVILLHTAADVITEWKSVPASWWWSAHLYNSLVRGCVALFVMVSGALLLPSQEALGLFFRKRWNRIGTPFLVWTLLYLVWRKFFYETEMSGMDALRHAAAGNVHFHLWFLYNLVGIYLVAPVFRIWAAHAEKKDVVYFLVLWFSVASLLPAAEHLLNLLGHARIRLKAVAEPAQGLIGYFVLGYALRRFYEPRWTQTAWKLALAGLLLCLAGTYFLTSVEGSFQSLFYENMAPNVVLYAIALFIWFRSAGEALEAKLSLKQRETVITLSKATLGIYLIHPMILDALIHGRFGFTLKANLPHPAWMIPFTAGVTYLLSFAAVFLIRKAPYLRRIV